MNTWLNSVIADFLAKGQTFGTLTEKQFNAFTRNMKFANHQFYGRTHAMYTYEAQINNETVTFKIQGNNFYIDSESLTKKYETFNNDNEIAKCKSMIERLERDLKENPTDERKQNMLNRKLRELVELTK